MAGHAILGGVSSFDNLSVRRCHAAGVMQNTWIFTKNTPAADRKIMGASFFLLMSLLHRIPSQMNLELHLCIIFISEA